MDVLGVDEGTVLSVHSLKALVSLTLYPSGTDLRTRIPTLSRLACTLAGNKGERTSSAREAPQEGCTLKKDVI
jgi:hypothetical protein